jgi:hypothetical protein
MITIFFFSFMGCFLLTPVAFFSVLLSGYDIAIWILNGSLLQ